MSSEFPVFPKKIVRGDTVGLFYAASPVREAGVLETGTRLLQDMGFRVKMASAGIGPCDYLAGSDAQRSTDLCRLWLDPEVKALVAVRGGYGCLRLLPQLDCALLAKHPKRVIGFSDLTVLLNVLRQEAGMVTFHGPVLTSLAKIDAPSRDHFFAMLTGSPGDLDLKREVEVLKTGIGRGRLAGGNLATVASLLGTRYSIPANGTILLLEDTGEDLYRLDRMLTQLALAGSLEQLSGLLLGTFDHRAGLSSDQQRLQEGVWERVLELVDGCDFPVWGNVPSGHLERNRTLPLGMEATMDSGSCVLRLHADSVYWAT